MNITIDNTTNNLTITNITHDELDFDKTLNCGQTFRWNKDASGNWMGIVDGKIWVLRQYDNHITTNIKIDDKEKLVSYFNLDMNYTNEISKLSLDDYARKAYEYGKGIHILRQDLFETMVTFLMSQFNSMHNIKLIINKLSERYGDKITEIWDGKEIMGYSFPTLDRLSECSYDDFMDCSIGLRTNYLITMLSRLKSNGDIFLDLKNCDYNKAICILKSFDGIGDKVANCIALFSLHHVEAFPIDVHIKRIINEEYMGDIDLSRYGNLAGIIQQYMFYYRAFIKK